MATVILQSLCIKCKSWIKTNQSYLILDLEPVFISVINDWLSLENINDTQTHITETDYICKSCWHHALKIVKTKVTSFSSKYEESNSNIISDLLELKTKHSCSDDEDTDNSHLQKVKKIKLEADQETNQSICTEHIETNSHNEVNEKEALNRNSEVVPLSDVKHNVKEEPLCGDDIENDCHDNKTIIKEEPVNRYDEYIDIDNHDIETTNTNNPLILDQGVEINCQNTIKTENIDNHEIETTNEMDPLIFDQDVEMNCHNTIKTEKIDNHDIETTDEMDPLIFNQGVEINCHNMMLKKATENNKTDDILTSYINKNTKTSHSNMKRNLLKYVCILCGCPVLKRQIKLTLCKEIIDTLPITNSSAVKKIDKYRLCNNCQNGNYKTATKIGDPANKTTELAIEKSNKSLIKHDQQTSLLKQSYNASQDLYMSTSATTLTEIHTKNILTDYKENKSNIEAVVQNTTLTVDSHNEDVQRSTPPTKIIQENTNISVDSDPSESIEVDLLESSLLDHSSDCESYIEVVEVAQPESEYVHSKEDVASNDEQYSDDPEWEPPKTYPKLNIEGKSATTAESSNRNQVQMITLDNYKRAPNNKSRCIFSKDCSVQYLQRLTLNVRSRLLKEHNYYVPRRCNVCQNHSKTNDWTQIINKNQKFFDFTAEQIEDLFSLLKLGKRLLSQINFDDISSIDDSIIQRWMGITREELTTLVDKVPEVRNIRRGMFGLAALLIKHHKGKTNEKVGKLMQMPRTTVEGKIKAVNKILNKHGIILEDFLSSTKITEQQSKRDQKKSGIVSRPQRACRKKKC